MTDKQINRWLHRRFSLVCWGLIGFYILLNTLATMGVCWEALRQALPVLAAGRFPEIDLYAASDNAWGYMLAAFVALAILDAWKGPDYRRQELFAKENRMSVRIFASLLCLCLGAQMINTLWLTLLETVMNLFGRSMMPILETVSGSSGSFSMFLYASIAAPVSEELIFRGYVLRSLRPYGKRFAVLATALLFGLFHGNLLQTPYAILMGLIMGYVTVEYSIVWAIAIHTFNNLVLADLLTRLTMHLPELALGLLNLLLFGGGLVLSLILLIANRKTVQAYRQQEWMDRRVLKCFFTNSGMIILTLIMLGNMVLMLLA